MRRRAIAPSLLVLLGAMGVVLAAPASAGAITTFGLSFTVGPHYGMVSGAYRCYDCANQMPPFTLSLERGGQVIASATGSPGVQLSVKPEPGDVARFTVDGVGRAAETFDRLPAIDDTCAAVGSNTIGGRMTNWHSVLTASHQGSVYESGAVQRSGDRFSATFNSPLRKGDTLVMSSSGSRTLSGTERMDVSSILQAQICPITGPTVEPKITGPRRASVRVRRNGRFTLPRTHVACPNPISSCSVADRAQVEVLRNRREVERTLGELDYHVPGGSDSALRGRLARKALRKLKASKRMKVRLEVGARAKPGNYTTHPVGAVIVVTLRAPR